MAPCTGPGSNLSSKPVCDTPPVAQFERVLRRWDPLRVAVVALGLAVLLMVAAYALDLISAPFTTEGLVAVLALIVVAGCGLLYAWRLGAGGIVE